MEKETLNNILHVFDLIHQNLINAKIGKHIAAVIAETGKTAEEVIKTVGLQDHMEPHVKLVNKVIDMHYDEFIQFVKTEDATIKPTLIGYCMRESGGKTNPGLVSQLIDKLARDYKDGRDKYRTELNAWMKESGVFSATVDFENPHFKAIVEMGEKATPWIRDTIETYPHVLERIDADGRIKPLWRTFKAPPSVFRRIESILEKYTDAFDFECCAEQDFVVPFIHQCGCASRKDIQILGQDTLEFENPSHPQRKGCMCIAKKQILACKPGRCDHKCLYCFWK